MAWWHGGGLAAEEGMQDRKESNLPQGRRVHGVLGGGLTPEGRSPHERPGLRVGRVVINLGTGQKASV